MVTISEDDGARNTPYLGYRMPPNPPKQYRIDLPYSVVVTDLRWFSGRALADEVSNSTALTLVGLANATTLVCDIAGPPGIIGSPGPGGLWNHVILPDVRYNQGALDLALLHLAVGLQLIAEMTEIRFSWRLVGARGFEVRPVAKDDPRAGCVFIEGARGDKGAWAPVIFLPLVLGSLFARAKSVEIVSVKEQLAYAQRSDAPQCQDSIVVLAADGAAAAWAAFAIKQAPPGAPVTLVAEGGIRKSDLGTVIAQYEEEERQRESDFSLAVVFDEFGQDSEARGLREGLSLARSQADRAYDRGWSAGWSSGYDDGEYDAKRARRAK